MRRFGKAPIRSCLAVLCGLQAGCSAFSLGEAARPPAPPPLAARESPEAQPACQRVRFTVAAAPSASPASASAPAPLFADQPELSADALVQEVLARNPTLAQMGAAWQAASARPAQVSSLDDPLFGAQVAPAAFGSNEVNGGYRLDVSQKVPWPGKRGLRGDNARAEASAAGHDVDDVRLQLIESARTTFYDYYLAERALEVNQKNLDLLREFQTNAANRYKNGLAPLQDVQQAKVEIGREQERRLGLNESRLIALARLNTLMHLAPDSPLPPSPKEVRLPESPPDVQVLRQSALARRPDLRALADHIAAEQAQLALAEKEFHPDFEVMAAYDTFWQERQLRSQVGVRLNLPVRTGKRHAAVFEAQARIAQRQAELARQSDQVNFQVQEAYTRLKRSEQSVRLYEKDILPAARANVDDARAAYTTGKIPFLSLVEAQRNEVSLRNGYFESLADTFRRRATLERVTGGPLVPVTR